MLDVSLERLAQLRERRRIAIGQPFEVHRSKCLDRPAPPMPFAKQRRDIVNRVRDRFGLVCVTMERRQANQVQAAIKHLEKSVDLC